MTATQQARLVVAANRLPVTWNEDDDQWVTSPGGLVSALAPVLEQRGGTWVGWNGGAGGDPDVFETEGFTNKPVVLDSDQIENHYFGFSNGTIWPLYHDAIRSPEYHRHWWRPHVTVNTLFAEAVTEFADEGDLIWVQDYQLQLVPGMLRDRLPAARIGFFLHIPFPPPEIFERLPWRRQVLEGLLGADYLGFQTRRAALNFAASAREFSRARGPAGELHHGDRIIRAEAVPISIDTAHYAGAAGESPAREVAEKLRSDLGNPDTIVVGVDRLDYTKGIDLRLRAFETLLETQPDLIGRVSLVQVAVPSRENVDEYQEIRRRVEEMVGRVNGRFGRADWLPIHYMYRSLPLTELVGAYLAADVMLVTPLRDGMNLVAKEYVATRLDNSGVLILSEFAGAAETMGDALIVNPYDIDGLADTLGRAVTMDLGEQQRRMRKLRRVVNRWDVHAWARHNIEAIET
ncbi:trehalose-6-phosphate synthase [soil metagenome]